MARRVAVWTFVAALQALVLVGCRPDEAVIAPVPADAGTQVDAAGALSGQDKDGDAFADAGVAVEAETQAWDAADAAPVPVDAGDADGASGSDEAAAADTATPDAADVVDATWPNVVDATWPDVALACVPADCDDGNACTSDACAAGACVHTDNAVPCSDGNVCTSGDLCQGGACLPSAATNCDDGNACTDDSCNPAKGCQHAILPVGTPCGGAQTCDGNGTCTLSAPAGMVLIPAGTFWMGCNSAKDAWCETKEYPQHKVTLSAFYMDLTETTVAQYHACIDAGACSAPLAAQPTGNATYPGLTQHPVNNVDWTQARQFCQWRGVTYDLPSEAQWEMAARGSCKENGSAASDPKCAAAMRKYPWGDDVATCSLAVMAEGTQDGCGTGATAAVGSKPAGDSPYGLHDMAGNVSEWVRDWYGPYGADAEIDPVEPGNSVLRIARGGSFTKGASFVRPSRRGPGAPTEAEDSLGFRCVRSYP